MRLHTSQGIDIAEFANVARWIEEIEKRPAVEKGLTVPPRSEAPMDKKAREALFGRMQYHRPTTVKA
jgi:GST-like protein